jgi:hypothetical protein
MVPAEQDNSPALKMAPEDEAELTNILATHPLETAASDARRFLASKGHGAGPATIPDFKGDILDQAVDYRRKHGVVNKEIDYIKPEPLPDDGAGGAMARGIADVPTMGFMDEMYGVAQALTKPSGHGFDHDMNAAIDQYRGTVDRDEKEHLPSRIVGQLFGGLGIPLSPMRAWRCASSFLPPALRLPAAQPAKPRSPLAVPLLPRLPAMR